VHSSKTAGLRASCSLTRRHHGAAQPRQGKRQPVAWISCQDAEAIPSQTLPDWIAAHLNALTALRCSARTAALWSVQAFSFDYPMSTLLEFCTSNG
jgi:hypothetical protein